MNSLRRLQEFGQSVYLDEISRGMLTDGTLETMIERDGLRGVTSNPAIFEKAIAQSNEYDDVIARLQAEGQSVDQIYEELVIADIQAAADLFRPLYEETDGRYGYVSLEVNPHLANDTEGTVEEARHLWRELARPNVFIKVRARRLVSLPSARSLVRVSTSTSRFSSASIATARVHRRISRGCRRGWLRATTSTGSLPWPRSSCPASTWQLTHGWPRLRTRVARMRIWRPACRGGSPSPMRRWRIRPTSGSSRARSSGRWRRRARGPSGSCGRLPEPRTRSTATSCM